MHLFTLRRLTDALQSQAARRRAVHAPSITAAMPDNAIRASLSGTRFALTLAREPRGFFAEMFRLRYISGRLSLVNRDRVAIRIQHDRHATNATVHRLDRKHHVSCAQRLDRNVEVDDLQRD